MRVNTSSRLDMCIALPLYQLGTESINLFIWVGCLYTKILVHLCADEIEGYVDVK